MKEKMLEYLISSEWNCTGNTPDENDNIRSFINCFFNKYQPKRSKREDLTTISPFPKELEDLMSNSFNKWLKEDC